MERWWPWPDWQAHRRVVVLLVVGWLLLWVFTYASWILDPSGRPRGMHPAALVVHLFVPLVAGALAWWWRPGVVRLSPARLLIALGGAMIIFVISTPLPSPIQFALSGIVLAAGGARLGLRGFGRSAIGGLVVFEASLAALLVVDAMVVAAGGVQDGPPGGVPMAIYEALEWGILLGYFGAALGWLGGLLAWLLRRALPRTTANAAGSDPTTRAV
ncbi:MAG: hypothetical protein ACYC4L_14960 [Chloroflexota bacterium]